MVTDERFDYFCEKWDELGDSEKIQLFNEYCSEKGCDDELFAFDEDFFNTFFEDKPMEAVRAAHFGNINWSDDYIKFNGYGNLESLCKYQAAQLADKYQREIYNLDKYDYYIDMDEYDFPEDEDDEEDKEDEE